MTPSEKAQWLIEEMAGGCCCCPKDAKWAAETCVDQIIKTLDEIIHDDVWDNKPIDMVSPTEYWQQVKEEIKKLNQ